MFRSALLASALVLGVNAPAFAQRPQLMDHFNTPWVVNAYNEPVDSDAIGMDGDYCVAYGSALEAMQVANFQQLTYPGGHTGMELTIPSNASPPLQCGGKPANAAAEWASKQGWPGNGSVPYGPSSYGYGYYETAMKPSCVPGISSSFFWIAAPNYGPQEWDIEFPNDQGHVFTDVHWTIHPKGTSIDYQLGFNPCQKAHRYGFLWTPGQIAFTVDGAVKYTMTDPSLVTSATGYVMGNILPGIANWGGGARGTSNQSPVAVVYQWIAYYPNVTSIPPH